MVNQATPDGERLHRHEILQHAWRRIGCGAAARSVVNEQRKRADGLLLLVEDQRAARTDPFHVGEDLRVDLLGAGQHAEGEL